MSEHRIASDDGGTFVSLGFEGPLELPEGHPSIQKVIWPPRFTVRLEDAEGDEYSLETTLELQYWHSGRALIVHHGSPWGLDIRECPEVTEQAVTLALHAVRALGVEAIAICGRHRFSVSLGAAFDAEQVFDHMMHTFERLLGLERGTIELKWLAPATDEDGEDEHEHRDHPPASS